MTETRAPADDGAHLLLRATYLLGRQILPPLHEAELAAHGPQVHRLRVLLASLSAWLARHDSAWLEELRRLELALHRSELSGAPDAEVRAAWSERAAATLRAADALTFPLRQVDLTGAALLTGQDPERVRAAIGTGELRDRGAPDPPRVELRELFDYARARGLEWADGLADDAVARAHEADLRARLRR